MNAHLIRLLLLGVFVFPLLVAAQQGGDGRQVAAANAAGAGSVERYSDPGNNFSSNVPINELSARAYRRFHKRFGAVETGETWCKSQDGYKVSFMLDAHHEFAYFGTGGDFLYSLRYYDGKEIPRETGEFVRRRYPSYKIDLVTEVNDGQKTFYMVQIMNPNYIKVLSVSDGRIDIIKELNNGSANIGPAEAAR
jgi:hypothetical protein